MTHVDLFSGIGGFALAARWTGIETIAFSEIEPYACKILEKEFGAFMANSDDKWKLQPKGSLEEIRQWISDGGKGKTMADANGERELQQAKEKKPVTKGRKARKKPGSGSQRIPNYGDIRAMRGIPCDIVTGGFPCQPFSFAGKRGGAEDHRALWPEMFRVIKESNPAWVLGENVPGIVSMELDNVLSDLGGAGYSTRTFNVPACAVDARHRRERIWIVAYSDQAGLQGWDGEKLRECEAKWTTRTSSPFTSDSARKRHVTQQGKGVPNSVRREQSQQREIGRMGRERESIPRNGGCVWEPESGLVRVANGIPDRAHRLKALGNAIVPQVAFQFLQMIKAIHDART